MNIPMRGVIEYGVRTLSLKGRAVLTSVVNEHRLELKRHISMSITQARERNVSFMSSIEARIRS